MKIVECSLGTNIKDALRKNKALATLRAEVVAFKFSGNMIMVDENSDLDIMYNMFWETDPFSDATIGPKTDK